MKPLGFLDGLKFHQKVLLIVVAIVSIPVALLTAALMSRRLK